MLHGLKYFFSFSFRPKLPPKYIPASQVPPTEDTPTTEPKKDGYDRLTSLGQEGQTEQVRAIVETIHVEVLCCTT